MLLRNAAQAKFYPTATLALEFTTGRYRVGAGGHAQSDFSALPGLSVTRASIGYAQRSDGTLVSFGNNVARITDQGLLVEESRTNKVLWSQDLSNAAWTKSNAVVTANVALAPDGTLTAAKLDEAATALFHAAYQTISGSVVAGSTNAVSICVKQGERRYAQVSYDTNDGVGAYANVDLQTGAVTQSGVLGTGTLTSVAVAALTNGWYRVALVGVAGAAATSGRPFVAPIPLGTTPWASATTGVVGNGIYVWGGQLEAGAFATSYIPTTGAAATRAADVISLGGLSTGDGTWVVSSSGLPATRAANSTLIGAAASQMLLVDLASHLTSYNGTNSITSANTPTWTGIVGAGVSWTTGRRALSAAGGATATDANVSGMAATSFLGSTNGSQPLNGYLRKVILYPTAFSDAQLQALTQ